jgi:hypothetical protein
LGEYISVRPKVVWIADDGRRRIQAWNTLRCERLCPRHAGRLSRGWRRGSIREDWRQRAFHQERFDNIRDFVSSRDRVEVQKPTGGDLAGQVVALDGPGVAGWRQVPVGDIESEDADGHFEDRLLTATINVAHAKLDVIHEIIELLDTRYFEQREVAASVNVLACVVGDLTPKDEVRHVVRAELVLWVGKVLRRHVLIQEVRRRDRANDGRTRIDEVANVIFGRQVLVRIEAQVLHQATAPSGASVPIQSNVTM